jgi:hypothetical protein
MSSGKQIAQECGAAGKDINCLLQNRIEREFEQKRSNRGTTRITAGNGGKPNADTSGRSRR